MPIEGGNPWGPREHRWWSIGGSRRLFQDAGHPVAAAGGCSTRATAGLDDGADQPGDGRQVLAGRGSDRQALRRRATTQRHGSRSSASSATSDRSVWRANTPYELYRTIEQAPFTSMTVVMRTRGGRSGAMIPSGAQIVASIDPALPVTGVQTMEQVVARVGGTAAPDVGADGAVRRARRHARDGRRLRRDGLQRPAPAPRVRHPARARRRIPRPCNAGRPPRRSRSRASASPLGAIGAWLLTRVLESMLNDVKPTDPTVFAGTAVAVLVVATLAFYLPARAAGTRRPDGGVEEDC